MRRLHGTGHHRPPATPIPDGSLDAGPIGSPRRRVRWLPHLLPCEVAPEARQVHAVPRLAWCQHRGRNESATAPHIQRRSLGPSSGRGRLGRGNVRAGPLVRSGAHRASHPGDRRGVLLHRPRLGARLRPAACRGWPRSR